MDKMLSILKKIIPQRKLRIFRFHIVFLTVGSKFHEQQERQRISMYDLADEATCSAWGTAFL